MDKKHNIQSVCIISHVNHGKENLNPSYSPLMVDQWLILTSCSFLSLYPTNAHFFYLLEKSTLACCFGTTTSVISDILMGDRKITGVRIDEAERGYYVKST